MIKNTNAYYDYHILEELECGMILRSWEVKALAANQCSIGGAFCRFIDGRLNLTSATIGPDTEDRSRNRELLLHAKELAQLSGKIQSRGLTIVPLKIYQKQGKFKLLIGVAQGKKKHDKRSDKKKTDIENETRRIVKSQKLGV